MRASTILMELELMTKLGDEVGCSVNIYIKKKANIKLMREKTYTV